MPQPKPERKTRNRYAALWARLAHSVSTLRFAERYSVRTYLLLMIVLMIVPWMAETALSLYTQDKLYRGNAIESSLAAARIVSSRVDDHFQTMDMVLLAVSAAVAPELGASEAIDAKLRQIQQLSAFVA